MNVAFFVSFLIFVFLALVTVVLLVVVVVKKGENIQLFLVTTILEALLGCFIQFGFDFAVTNVPVFLERVFSGERVEEVFSNESIEMANHKHSISKTVSENLVEATCTEPGLYDKVEYCECGEELSRESISIQPLGHDYRAVQTPATCTESGYTTYTCMRCGDSYQDSFTDALGHRFVDGVCDRCGYKDPNYIKTYSGEDIVRELSESVVATTGGFKTYLGDESVSVFARDYYNAFSIHTLVWYNMWGDNVQSVTFNVTDLNENESLNFKIGGRTGSKGGMTLSIYVDRPIEGDADYSYDLEASDIPRDVSIDIMNATSLSFLVTNHAGNENTLVFYDFHV